MGISIRPARPRHEPGRLLSPPLPGYPARPLTLAHLNTPMISSFEPSG
jgi:hypothetical protein